MSLQEKFISSHMIVTYCAVSVKGYIVNKEHGLTMRQESFDFFAFHMSVVYC